MEVKIDECFCLNNGSTLNAAPCPPPFFYQEFGEFALSRGLLKEEACEIATKCMSRYSVPHSSQIISNICSPTTTSTTTTTMTSSSTSISPSASSSTPFTPITSTIPPVPPICDVICIVFSVVCAFLALIVLILLIKWRERVKKRIATVWKYFKSFFVGQDGRIYSTNESSQGSTFSFTNPSFNGQIHTQESVEPDGRASACVQMYAISCVKEDKSGSSVDDTEISEERFQDKISIIVGFDDDYDASSVEEFSKPMYSETDSMVTLISATILEPGNDMIDVRPKSAGLGHERNINGAIEPPKEQTIVNEEDAEHIRNDTTCLSEPLTEENVKAKAGGPKDVAEDGDNEKDTSHARNGTTASLQKKPEEETGVRRGTDNAERYGKDEDNVQEKLQIKVNIKRKSFVEGTEDEVDGNTTIEIDETLTRKHVNVHPGTDGASENTTVRISITKL